MEDLPIKVLYQRIETSFIWKFAYEIYLKSFLTILQRLYRIFLSGKRILNKMRRITMETLLDLEMLPVVPLPTQVERLCDFTCSVTVG